MWYDHPFSQGNKTTKKRGLDKQNLEKKKGVGEGGGVGNIGKAFIK